MRRAIVALALGLGLGILYPVGALLAGEHGGQEHGGAAPAAADDEEATLREAADALRATHPDLAAKLDALADQRAG